MSDRIGVTNPISNLTSSFTTHPIRSKTRHPATIRIRSDLFFPTTTPIRIRILVKIVTTNSQRIGSVLVSLGCNDLTTKDSQAILLTTNPIRIRFSLFCPLRIRSEYEIWEVDH